MRRDASDHPSPNGGVVEAAFAAALGVRLGGENRYGDRTEHRASLGDGPRPGPDDITRAVQLSHHLGLVLAGALALPTALRVGRGLRRRVAGTA